MRHDHVGARSCLPKGRMTLKPALEPIALARKPLSEKTVAANVLRWGTGVINVDGCRIPTNDKLGGGAENPATDAVYKAGGWDRPWMHDEKPPQHSGMAESPGLDLSSMDATAYSLAATRRQASNRSASGSSGSGGKSG
jgi:hypothetical protein